MTAADGGKMMTGGGIKSVWSVETSWTLIKAAAGAGGGNGDDDARREVFARYYRPVCAYISAIVRDPDLAQDYAHDFFLEKVFKAEGEGLLGKADPKRKFRPYLKKAVRFFLIDRWRQKGRDPIPVDPNDPAGELLLGCDWPDPDDIFHREWVRILLDRALQKVRTICEKKNQAAYLEIFLARFASEDERPPSWREIGARYELDEKEARRRADTVQRRFRTALREVLTEEEGSPEAADEELATLLAILRSFQ